MSVIEQGKLSHMWVHEEAPRYEVANIDFFYSRKWYAGAIAHEVTHSQLYHEYQAEYGLPVPALIWSSVNAEKACMQYQIDIMKKINAPQFDIDNLLSELAAIPALVIFP